MVAAGACARCRLRSIGEVGAFWVKYRRGAAQDVGVRVWGVGFSFGCRAGSRNAVGNPRRTRQGPCPIYSWACWASSLQRSQRSLIAGAGSGSPCDPSVRASRIDSAP